MNPSRRILVLVVMAVVVVALGAVGPSAASGSCVGPAIGVGPTVDPADPPTSGGTIRRGDSITVTGALFHSGCADTYSTGAGCSGSPARPDDPEAPLSDVRLTLHQRSRSWVIARGDATGPHYSISWTGRLPLDVKPGPAELRAGSASLAVSIR